jgi:hypothetical protein
MREKRQQQQTKTHLSKPESPKVFNKYDDESEYHELSKEEVSQNLAVSSTLPYDQSQARIIFRTGAYTFYKTIFE